MLSAIVCTVSVISVISVIRVMSVITVISICSASNSTIHRIADVFGLLWIFSYQEEFQV